MVDAVPGIVFSPAGTVDRLTTTTEDAVRYLRRHSQRVLTGGWTSM